MSVRDVLIGAIAAGRGFELLEAAEREAVDAGLLRPHHYERTGVEPLPGAKLSADR